MPGVRRGAIRGEQAAFEQAVFGGLPLPVGPAALGLEFGAREVHGGAECERFAAVEAGGDEGRDMAVAAVFAEHGGGVPEAFEGGVGEVERAVRGGQYAPGAVQVRGALGQGLGGPLHLALVPGEQPGQRGRGAGAAQLQGALGGDQGPDGGEGAGHHGRGEAEEGGHDGLRPDRAEGRGAAREVAAPEAAEARVLVRGQRLRREVRDRVDRLEQGPHRAGRRRRGGFHGGAPFGVGAGHHRPCSTIGG
ncbi:hypothetical protein SAZ11_15090 [Streptomyces sp. FXJ1.4098]|nr:hypothetical protein [Streptomyces sp. FXJ1.4098]